MESDRINNDNNSDDDDDDDAWEFKDAFLDTKAQNQTFVTHAEDSPSYSSTKLEQKDFVDFYSKLKDESCFVTLSHFENLKVGELPMICIFVEGGLWSLFCFVSYLTVLTW